MPFVKDGSVKAVSHDGQHISSVRIETRGSKRKESHGGGGEKPVSPLKFLIDDEDDCYCGQCKKQIGKKGKSIACDRCEAWYHLGCADMLSEEFKFLHRSQNNNIKWFCRSCTPVSTDKSSDNDLFAKQETKLNQVLAMVRELKAQNEEILKKLNEEKLDLLVKAHVQEQIDTKNEREERKNNIIIFNLDECEEDGIEKERKHDKREVGKLFGKICPEVEVKEIREENFVRLGRKANTKVGSGVQKKNRPIKVVLPEEQSKGKILKKAKNLRGLAEYSKVGIAPDKTMKERMEDKKLRTELKTRKQNNEDVVVFNGKVMLRTEIAAEKQRMREGEGKTRVEDDDEEGSWKTVQGRKRIRRGTVIERGQSQEETEGKNDVGGRGKERVHRGKAEIRIEEKGGAGKGWSTEEKGGDRKVESTEEKRGAGEDGSTEEKEGARKVGSGPKKLSGQGVGDTKESKECEVDEEEEEEEEEFADASDSEDQSRAAGLAGSQ